MADVKLITRRLQDELIQYFERADTIYLLISFLMESGVRLIAPYLRDAAARGADIKILTGDYLYVTQPQALAHFITIDPGIEVRLWKSHGESFHPKAYLFDDSKESSVMVVGSSNLSASALTEGVEWNLAVNSDDVSDSPLDQAKDEFMKMFYDDRTVLINPESLQQYGQIYEEYHRTHPNLARDWTTLESHPHKTVLHGLAAEHVADSTHPYQIDIQPRPAQLEALEQLRITLDEGYDKALVVMATGLGKTYLAAMFATNFRRVLFIAHREEILFQAQKAFKLVMPQRSCGVYYGREKNVDTDFVFASINTLGIKKHRLRFSPTDFDLIIIDEFHHAAAKSYQNVIHYFEPTFLLGITATADRADGRDVYAICDGNVAYKMDFLEAIQRGWLANFHYYGIYDETDYSQIRWLGLRYDEQELLAAQLRDSMAETIYKAWLARRKTRTLVFCSSIAQANFLCQYFVDKGVHAISLNSRNTGMNRAEAIQRLERGELDAIFTVDLFNEGVDIPAVDTLLFVRPTESLTIFTQQIGRGLRLHDGKDHCVIIDLIGNYRNADVKLGLFQVSETIEMSLNSLSRPVVPANCLFDLDTRVIQLMEEMRKKRRPRKELLRDSYLTVKQDLGRRPTYEETHLHGTSDSRGYKQEFTSWPGFLAWAGELDAKETLIAERYAAWFKELESTGMTKSYKMILLLAMLQRGPGEWYQPFSAGEAAPFFHQYLTEK